MALPVLCSYCIWRDPHEPVHKLRLKFQELAANPAIRPVLLMPTHETLDSGLSLIASISLAPVAE